MEIPAEILEQLRCDNCGEYLSCAPVFLTKNTKSLCGRCTQDEADATRNSPYEQVAQLLKFPCMNQVYGCTRLVSFAECKSHEDGCEYQRYLCPVAPSGTCDWIGNQNNLLKHCRHHHSDTVVSNPMVLTHDITKPSLQTFIMSALNVLFILHAKVCLDTKTIYHSVRFLGDPSRASSYMFNLLIMNDEDSEFRKRRDVEPQGWLTLETPSALATNIDHLQGMIGEFRGTTFTLTVNSKCAQCNFTVESKQTEANEWLCRSCTIDQRPCKYRDKGCMYVDVERKSFKHERFFCQYSNWCEFCSKCITSNLEKHYKTFHISARCSSRLLWTDFISSFWKLRIIETDFGYALCHYSLNIGNIIISVRSSLSSDQLQNYKCQIELTHPATEYTVKRILQAQYSDVNDWFTIIYVKDLQISEDNKFKINIHLTKNLTNS